VTFADEMLADHAGGPWTFNPLIPEKHIKRVSAAENALLTAQALELQTSTNALWAKQLGPHTDRSGFQVEPFGILHEDTKKHHPLFVSTLFGGRWLIGTATQVRESCEQYIESRRRGKAAS
jgi:hypothetical protein